MRWSLASSRTGRRFLVVAASVLIATSLAGCSMATLSPSPANSILLAPPRNPLQSSVPDGGSSSSPGPTPTATAGSVDWRAVPTGNSPAAPRSRGSGEANLEGWSKGYVEFVYSPDLRAVTPWNSSDGLRWVAGKELDLAAWAPDYKAWDATVAAASATEYDQLDGKDCHLDVDQFEEGPATLLVTGHLVCAMQCAPFEGGKASWTSQDGLSWTPLDRPKAFGHGGVGRISGGSRGFVAVGGGTPQNLWLSADGQTWRNGHLPADASQAGASAGDPAAFDGGYVLPGVVVTESGTPVPPGISCGTYYSDDPGQPTYQGALWWSPDGSNWTRDSLSGLVSGAHVEMSVEPIDDHTLIAYETASADPVVWISRDGKSWTLVQGYRATNGYFRIFEGRDQSLITDCPPIRNQECVPTLFVVNSEFDMVPLVQIGEGPALSPDWVGWGPVALGPAGLLATDDGSHFWIGVFRIG